MSKPLSDGGLLEMCWGEEKDETKGRRIAGRRVERYMAMMMMMMMTVRLS